MTGHARRGQSMVEFALLLPLLLVLVVGTLEFGFIFDHHLTLEYSTREGARVGSALANGGGPLGCSSSPPNSPNWMTVDHHVIAAAQRVLTSPGSPIDLADVGEIRIYKANSTGGETAGLVNVWNYDPGGGPVVDGQALDFSQTSVGWQACARTNTTNPDSIGVSLVYTYHYRMVVTSWFGTTELSMRDRTVMQLNPTAL